MMGNFWYYVNNFYDVIIVYLTAWFTYGLYLETSWYSNCCVFLVHFIKRTSFLILISPFSVHEKDQMKLRQVESTLFKDILLCENQRTLWGKPNFLCGIVNVWTLFRANTVRWHLLARCVLVLHLGVADWTEWHCVTSQSSARCSAVVV